MDLEVLSEMNPWWESGSVPLSLRRESPREVLDKLLELLKPRQIISLVGLRRTGKTTLMYQMIDYLLKEGTPPRNILYFSFDERVESIRDLIKTYMRSLPGVKKGRVYLFLDEIQKHPDWANRVKLLYDLHPDYKIILSGSASLEIARSGGESLAGRIIPIRIGVLDFTEFLHFSGREVPIPPEDLEQAYAEYVVREDKLNESFKDAVVKGGFIETIGMEGELLKYFLNASIVDNVVMKDIPERYSISNPAALKEILRLICTHPGMLLSYENFADIFHVTRQTISKYIYYMADSFILSLKYNYSGSFAGSVRRLKRAYPAHPTLTSAFLSSDPPPQLFGRMVENYVLETLGYSYFYRRGSKEIDAVVRYGEGVVPVEVKYTTEPRRRDVGVVERFVERFGSPFGVILTRDSFARQGRVMLLPIPLFLTLRGDLKLIESYMKKR